MILKHPKDRRYKQQGFTLTELLVVMAMTGIVMAAVYSICKSRTLAIRVPGQRFPGLTLELWSIKE